jgi:hypothetical protein
MTALGRRYFALESASWGRLSGAIMRVLET